MITDKERRDAAARLRTLTDGESPMTERSVDALYTALGFPWSFGTGIECSVIRHLADLIEPVPERTCRMIDNGAELCCSECDWRHDYDDEPKFCAGCGALITDAKR